MKIRKFKSTDKNAVIELWRTVFSDDPPHNEPANVLEAKLAVDNLIFVAEDKAKVIGACMAGYDGHRGWLYSVAVYPEYRRGGTGTKLIKFAMETLKKMGCIKVNLQIRSPNTVVAKFYESLGFKTEDRMSMGAFIE